MQTNDPFYSAMDEEADKLERAVIEQSVSAIEAMADNAALALDARCTVTSWLDSADALTDLVKREATYLDDRDNLTLVLAIGLLRRRAREVLKETGGSA